MDIALAILAGLALSLIGVGLGQLWYKLVDRYGWRGWYSDD